MALVGASGGLSGCLGSRTSESQATLGMHQVVVQASWEALASFPVIRPCLPPPSGGQMPGTGPHFFAIGAAVSVAPGVALYA